MFDIRFVAHPLLICFCEINNLTVWFLPSFAHYFKKLTTALDSIRINFNSVWENLTFNVENTLWCSIFAEFVAHPLLICFCEINNLSVWFLPSFAHYFKKLSTALDSKRINFNSVWENLTFNVENTLWCSIFLSRFVAHPLLIGFCEINNLTVWFLPSFAHYFKKLTTALDSKRINFNSVWENLTFNVQNILWSSIFLSHLLPITLLSLFLCNKQPICMILTIFRPLF